MIASKVFGFMLLATLNASSHGRAMDIEEFDRIKAANARILSGCVDLEMQSHAQRQSSDLYARSLAVYLKANLRPADRQREITGDLAGVGTDDTHTVLIFAIESALAAKPGQALRSERRHRLEQLIKSWRDTLPKPARPLLVRFDDECYVPVVDWK